MSKRKSSIRRWRTVKSGFSRELSFRELLARELLTEPAVIDAGPGWGATAVSELHALADSKRVVLSVKSSASGKWFDAEATWVQLSRWLVGDGAVDGCVEELFAKIVKREATGLKFSPALFGGPRVLI